MKKINKKHIIMGIYNILIVLFILTIDWSDWGGIIALPILIFLILIFNPILNFIVYRKEKDKSIHIFVSYIITILVAIIFYVLKAVLIDNVF